MSNVDPETIYCSFEVDDFIICECGDTFSDEDSLRLHLENNHHGSNHVETAEEQIIEEQAYFLEETDGVEETVIATEYFTHDDGDNEGNQQIGSEEAPEETIKQEPEDEPSPGHAEAADGKNVAVIVTNNGLQTCKEVEFKVQREIILVEGGEEHNYDLVVPKQEVEELYFCETCGRSFDDVKSVRIHAARAHVAGTAPRVKRLATAVCNICQKEYKDVIEPTECECGGHLVRPKRRPKPDGKKYTCEICGSIKQSNAALKYHQRTHTGEKPYQCTMCPKAFTMPIFLQIHTRTHTGERPYACKLCPKAFTNQAALQRHDRVHTGEKPYVCGECGKAFSQSNSMKLHIHTVHLRLPTPYKSTKRRQKELRRMELLELAKRIPMIVREQQMLCSEPEDETASVSVTKPRAEAPPAAAGMFKRKGGPALRLNVVEEQDGDEEGEGQGASGGPQYYAIPKREFSFQDDQFTTVVIPSERSS